MEADEACSPIPDEQNQADSLSFSISRILSNSSTSACKNGKTFSITRDVARDVHYSINQLTSSVVHPHHQGTPIYYSSCSTSPLYSNPLTSCSSSATSSTEGSLRRVSGSSPPTGHDELGTVLRVPAHRPMTLPFSSMFPWMESRRLVRDRLTGEFANIVHKFLSFWRVSLKVKSHNIFFNFRD